jgi:preprotein translocase subunit SecG
LFILVIALKVIFVIVCLLLIGAVLLQSGKGGDPAAAFGGAGAQSAFGPRGAAKPLEKATIYLALTFMGLALLFSLPGFNGSYSVVRSGATPAATPITAPSPAASTEATPVAPAATTSSPAAPEAKPEDNKAGEVKPADNKADNKDSVKDQVNAVGTEIKDATKEAAKEVKAGMKEAVKEVAPKKN